MVLESRVVRYLIYGTTAVLVSEVVYHSYQRLSRWLARRAFAAKEVAEVIWTNELTQTCAGSHRSNSAAAPTASAPASTQVNMVESGHIVRLPSPIRPSTSPSVTVCRNPFCAAYNMGRLIELIDACEYSIDLAMYTFTSYELSQALNRALSRNVAIRIISDKEMVYSSGSQIIQLTKAGVPVRYPTSTMLMHHKFCILDGSSRACSVLAKLGRTYDTSRVRGILMSGSLNWTMQGFGGNWENLLITSNCKLVTKFEEEFERMWKAFEANLGPLV